MNYPTLTELSTKDLIALLGSYIQESEYIRELDADFIEALQAELKTRRDVGVE